MLSSHVIHSIVIVQYACLIYKHQHYNTMLFHFTLYFVCYAHLECELAMCSIWLNKCMIINTTM